MFNVGGGEFLVILLVALIVLGPQKLPEAARQVASMARELRKVSSGFQAEMRAALDDPMEEAARERGNRIVSSEQSPAPDVVDDEDDDDDRFDDFDDIDDDDADEDGMISTAEAAGMYDVAPEATSPSDLSNVAPPFTAVNPPETDPADSADDDIADDEAATTE